MTERGQVQEESYLVTGLTRQPESLQHEDIREPATVGRVRHDVPSTGLLLGEKVDAGLTEAIVVPVGAYHLMAGCGQLVGNGTLAAGRFPNRAVKGLHGQERPHRLRRRGIELLR